MNDWRKEPSVVTAVKEAYRGATPIQRKNLRAWMHRVLDGSDSNDYSNDDIPGLLKVYARHETNERGKGVQIYRDKAAKVPFAFFPHYYKTCPKRNHKTVTLNCYEWQIVWLKDAS